VRIILVALVLLVVFGHSIADTLIEYQWWKEVNQAQTWWTMVTYGFVPVLLGTLVAAAIVWVAFARGLKFGGSGLRHMPWIARVSPLGALVVGFMVSAATIDRWAIMRYAGSSGNPPQNLWADPVFGHPLSFYLFDLPMWRTAHSFVLVMTLVPLAVYWLAARGGQIRRGFEVLRDSPSEEPDFRGFRLEGTRGWGLESTFLRAMGAVFLLSMALRFFLARYDLLVGAHSFMTGIDWTDEQVRLPLLWAMVAACVLAAALLAAGAWKTAVAAVALPLAIQAIVPRLVGSLYVRPNEINIEKPYIARHIEATRAAYGLATRVTEAEYTTRAGARIDTARHKPLLDNVRLWDWRAFHDTVTQVQALRPYYVFQDTDVDRYMIDGQLRQVMLTPRELDIRQLPDARTRWINPHFIYTHGYGMVMAESNQITSDGLPKLFVQDAPPKIETSSLKLARPEIYYGEVTHEPVIVRSSQKEFSYPSGNDSVFTRYDGTGGFPIASPLMRLAAAVRDADFNLILTNLVTPDSRMMIHRKVLDRLNTAAGFLTWDSDPYLVVTNDGRLVWTVDGYTTSASHPYSQALRLDSGGRVNYIRNSVKATVDAYHGTIHLYVADPADPIIQAYRSLFPSLLEPISAMPADLRAHTRYPEFLFRIQAEIYRTYHMRDPQAFYNKEDVWDIARKSRQRGQTESLAPTYVVATLPEQDKPEFLLTIPFTPRGKDNLIGVMMARCDGDALGELRFLQLSKQALIFGPMQIDARIDQDPDISKDLTLWNQQGSEVLRGQMLVLPVDNTFLYVEPIYLQASQARMPQLKKVVVASGNELVYRNTYEEALAALAGRPAPAATVAAGQAAPTAQAVGATDADRRLGEVRQRLRRYRELWGQGKYGEAGRELEALEGLLR
jgi:uncharacterized membrane protein (UPF0182 family)